MKKSVVKVSIINHKSKREILKAVAGLEGIDGLSIDKEKGTLTVIGEVDPTCIVKQLRKKKKSADIISVGPLKPAKEEKPPNPSGYCPPPFPPYVSPYCGTWYTYDRW